MTRTERLASLACLLGTAGFIFEWCRQRGSCEFGDNSPDTLGLSIIMILLGGSIGLGVALIDAVAILRRGWRGRIQPLVLGVLAASLTGILFSAAGDGPGAWFQYCAT